MVIASSLFPVCNGVSKESKTVYAVKMPEIMNLKNTVPFHTAAADTFYQQYNWQESESNFFKTMGYLVSIKVNTTSAHIVQ